MSYKNGWLKEEQETLVVSLRPLTILYNSFLSYVLTDTRFVAAVIVLAYCLFCRAATFYLIVVVNASILMVTLLKIGFR